MGLLRMPIEDIVQKSLATNKIDTGVCTKYVQAPDVSLE